MEIQTHNSSFVVFFSSRGCWDQMDMRDHRMIAPKNIHTVLIWCNPLCNAVVVVVALSCPVSCLSFAHFSCDSIFGSANRESEYFFCILKSIGPIIKLHLWRKIPPNKSGQCSFDTFSLISVIRWNVYIDSEPIQISAEHLSNAQQLSLLWVKNQWIFNNNLRWQADFRRIFTCDAEHSDTSEKKCRSRWNAHRIGRYIQIYVMV